MKSHTKIVFTSLYYRFSGKATVQNRRNGGGEGERKLVTVPGSREVSCMNMPNLNLNFGTIQELLFAQKESLHSL